MKFNLATTLIGLVHISNVVADTPSLVDPRTRFPGHYTLPNQTFPGLQSNWNPPIDSGEQSYVGTGRLKGRKALITGGDSGIGRAVAIAYAREGADVTINYLPEEQSDADEVQQYVEDAGVKFHGIPGNLRNETFCTDLVQQAHAAMGGLDILVSNAGWANNQPNISELTGEQIRRTFETNVFASLFLTRAAVPLMPGGSSIMFTASTTGRLAVPYLVDYSATKAALVSMARTLGVQLTPSGIRVNAVAPGMTYTNFLTSQGQTQESVEAFATAFLPLGRLEQPVEVAPLYVMIAAGENTASIGSIYSSNGGDTGF
ncbi:unnamed protein product [Clonostachys solani]|uniref:Uncharacterized protein n=1 Tax=Clonostachys solani TaxID=160281 RepID=A0A9P0EMH7_9HYPO|nr:unnamed protein product [Clonostachys solani]